MERLPWRALTAVGVHCWVRRDDCLPVWGQGNKFYKLYFNLQLAPETAVLVSFGGAFSNHIHALALAGQHLGRKTVGIIRGERPARLSPTLVDAERAGMQLHFVSRAQYRTFTQAVPDADWRQHIAEWVGAPSAWVIPEGGNNAQGLQGCRVLGEAIAPFVAEQAINEVLLATGTGTTLAGVAQGLAGAGCSSAGSARVTGISVLGAPKPGDTHLQQQIADSLGRQDPGNWSLLEGFHEGGYGRTSPALLAFMADFERENGVALDQVYTGKLFWAVANLARQGRWPAGTQLLLLHTGGLQGLRGLDF